MTIQRYTQELRLWIILIPYRIVAVIRGLGELVVVIRSVRGWVTATQIKSLLSIT